MFFRLALAPAILFALLLIAPGSAESKRFNFPEMIGGVVSVEIPEGWSGSFSRSAIPEVATARFKPDSSDEPVIMITIIAAVPGSPFADATASSVEDIVSKSAARVAVTSVEGTLTVESFTGDTIFGSYFSATDRAPPEGEFKYLSEGVASFGSFAVTFTALSHTSPLEARSIMLGIVRSVK